MIETILVAVGDSVLREFAVVVLRGYGYNVLVASDAASASNVAAAHRGSIHLFVTDINPGINGAALPPEILTTRPKLRFVYLFGHTYYDFVRGALGPRVRLLHKLFSPMSLARTVRDTLESARKDDTE